jgi:1-aminocyclopropane-1-carboxylate deaminase/D-cysteine desulfhydrase-like pyridoxal-dependent ACC family enzyme
MTPITIDHAPREELLAGPTPVQEMWRLRAVLGGGRGWPRLLVKRDDAIPFGFGGNKVRKLEFVLPEALAAKADTLVTLGGLQSNHARATAAAAAKLGLRCVLIINGSPQERPSGNALLDQLLGAEVEYIASRAERASAIERVMTRLESAGRRPFMIPLGASTPTGALGFAAAIDEMIAQGVRPDVIVHAGSSGGTQAGLVAGVARNGLATRVIAVSADDPAASVASTVRSIVRAIPGCESFDDEITVDDTMVGEGYGIPTNASREAQQLLARSEALFVDHTYTAKAAAALIAYARDGRISSDETVLFWHTGGQVGLFA